MLISKALSNLYPKPKDISGDGILIGREDAFMGADIRITPRQLCGHIGLQGVRAADVRAMLISGLRQQTSAGGGWIYLDTRFNADVAEDLQAHAVSVGRAEQFQALSLDSQAPDIDAVLEANAMLYVGVSCPAAEKGASSPLTQVAGVLQQALQRYARNQTATVGADYRRPFLIMLQEPNRYALPLFESGLLDQLRGAGVSVWAYVPTPSTHDQAVITVLAGTSTKILFRTSVPSSDQVAPNGTDKSRRRTLTRFLVIKSRDSRQEGVPRVVQGRRVSP